MPHRHVSKFSLLLLPISSPLRYLLSRSSLAVILDTGLGQLKRSESMIYLLLSIMFTSVPTSNRLILDILKELGLVSQLYAWSRLPP